MRETVRRAVLGVGATCCVLALSVGAFRSCADRRVTLRVMAADALAIPFQQLADAFERENPDARVSVTVEGSVMLLRMHLLHPADVVAFADHRLIEEALRPEDADWLVKFATTEIVVARTQASRYADEITADNWAEVLLRPNVLVASPDSATDSCGYYTRLAWKLAERHYGTQTPGLFDQLVAKVPAQYQRPDALSILALLESRAVDYAFVYRCHAEAHHLPYTRLPEDVGLGKPALESAYSGAEVEVPDFKGQVVKMKGHPIYFGLTISKRSRQQALAERFVRFVLSANGQGTLRSSDLVPLTPPHAPAWATGLPQSLRDVVQFESGPRPASPDEAR